MGIPFRQPGRLDAFRVKSAKISNRNLFKPHGKNWRLFFAYPVQPAKPTQQISSWFPNAGRKDGQRMTARALSWCARPTRRIHGCTSSSCRSTRSPSSEHAGTPLGTVYRCCSSPSKIHFTLNPYFANFSFFLIFIFPTSFPFSTTWLFVHTRCSFRSFPHPI